VDDPAASTQLLLFGFGPDASFEGRLVGALERMESGGTLRVVDVLFIRREADTGELSAIGLQSHGAGGMVGPLIGFRLDERERRRASARALLAEDVQALGRALAPGAAIAAVLVDHVWSRALADAFTSTGGTPLGRDFVQADSLSAVADRVLAAATAR